MAGRARESLASLQAQVEQLTRELAEARAEQMATAEVIRVMSESPTDLSRVFDVMAERALRLCSARDALVWQVEGETMVLRAVRAERTRFAVGDRQPTNLQVPGARASREGRTIHVTDTRDLDPRDWGYWWIEAMEQNGIRSFLAVPMLGQGTFVGNISVRRQAPGGFSPRQIALLETFADQAVIAIENSRLIGELQQRLEEQTATGEILRLISRSPTDLPKVLDGIGETAVRLCDAATADLTRLVGDQLVTVGGFTTSARMARYRAEWKLQGITGVPARSGSVAGRAIIEHRTIRVHDLVTAVKSDFPDAREVQRNSTSRSLVATPLLSNGEAIGALVVSREEVRPFTDRQVALLETFADQAGIAISNAELFQQLQERNKSLSDTLERQTATSEILRVISNSPTDIQPVLETIVANAARLCRGSLVGIYRASGDRLIIDADVGLDDAGRELIRRSPPKIAVDTAGGRAALFRQVISIPDVLADPHYTRSYQSVIGHRSILAVPLLRDNDLLGVLQLAHPDVNAYSEDQIKLIQTFADQAIIAIDHTRLFTELQQRLEEQTATSEILRVIGRAPTDLPKVLDAIAEAAVRLSGSAIGFIQRLAGDYLVSVGSHINLPEERRAQLIRDIGERGIEGIRATAGTVSGRAMLERRTIHVHDMALAVESQFPDSPRELQRVGGQRSQLATPLLRNGEPIGILSVSRLEVHPYSDRQIALLETFADQAVIAISNAELFQQLQDRNGELSQSLKQLRGLFDVSQAVSSTLDVETVLSTVSARAVILSGADGGGIFELDERSQLLRLRTAHQIAPELAAVLRQAPLHVGEGATGRAVATRGPVQVPDATIAGDYQSSVRDILIRSGYRALLAVPLLHENQVLGALVLNRNTPGEFAPEIVELVKTFASQSAIALQNARLFQELEEKSHQLEIASQHKSQFLANMSHELRTPLNAILGYTELIQDGIYGDVPGQISTILERVGQSGRHLLGLINAVLDLSKIEAGQLALAVADYSLAEVVQLAFASVESLAGEKNLALHVDLAPDLPVGRGDERRISQVILNLVGNAIKFTEAGEIRVTVGASGGQFVVSVADTGAGIAPADQERIFDEFQQLDASSTRAKGGTGLGLSIAKRIVELHGGRLWVESTPGLGSTFTFVLPITVPRTE